MLKLTKTFIAGAAVSVFTLGLGLSAANATEGYFANGIGARHKGLAGAGVADSRDATATTNNPAGLVHVDDQIALSASLFSPIRKFTGLDNNPSFTPGGEVKSKSNYFGIPNFALSKRIHGIPLFDVVGFSVSGNGGMNTNYRNRSGANSGVACPGFGLPGGVFCLGKTGINLEQMLIQATAAKKFNGFSIGVGAIVARQVIHIQGLGAFAAFSSNFTNVSNQGTDDSYGFGLRAGLEAELMPNVRFGLTGTSPMWMSEFDKYSGLFAGQGDFDIPPSLQVGLAVDVTPNVTIMADFKRIWYSYTASVSNPGSNIFNCTPIPAAFPPTGPGCLGNSQGAGFGWDDINVYKVAIEARDVSPGLTLRAGYAYSENPINPEDVMFNIIAPGIVKHHITAGGTYKMSDSMDLEFAALYVPENTVRGPELALGPGLGNRQIELSMKQYELTLGVVYHFGGGDDAPLK